jgi:hypothetical protein
VTVIVGAQRREPRHFGGIQCATLDRDDAHREPPGCGSASKKVSVGIMYEFVKQSFLCRKFLTTLVSRSPCAVGCRDRS